MRIPYRITPFLALLPLLLSACGGDDIRSYEAPKEEAPAPAPAAGGMGQMANAPEVPHWEVPAGWEEIAGSGMRWATLLPEPGNGALEVRVTPLGLVAADPLSNANRWAGQVGLAPMDEAGLAEVSHRVSTRNGEALILDLVGPEQDGQPAQRILAAIVEGQQRVWFLMMPGEAAAVEPHADEFEQFIRSIRLGPGDIESMPSGAVDPNAELPEGHPPVATSLPEGHPEMGSGMPEGHPPVSGMPDGHPQVAAGQRSSTSGTGGERMTWITPADWHQVDSDVAFRELTLQAGNAEVAVTKFPGSVGGLLMNVNRWRGQVGLSSIESLELQPLTPVEVDGAEAKRLDLAGPDGAMAVVLVDRGEMSWFLKMSGSGQELAAQESAFREFVSSVRFEGAS